MAVSTIDPNGLNIGQIGGRRNIVTNGAMTIQQRGTQTNQTSGYTACDRWQFNEAGASIVTTSQDTDVPSGTGFGRSLKVDVTNASGTPAASNYAFLRTKFEGQDLQNICKGTSEAKQLTLSFWVKSPKTGTHIVELYDHDNSRQVSKSYSVTTANTWQYVSVVFPADTTGQFDNDNGNSLQITFHLMAGSAFSSGTLNTSWATSVSANRAVGQVNVMDDVANNFYLTGVQLEVGDVATPFEHRSYGEELALCQRYFYRYTGASDDRWAVYLSYNNSTISQHLSFPVTMRATPTGTVVSNGLLRVRAINDGVSGEITPTTLNCGAPTPTKWNLNVNASLSNAASILAFSSVLNFDAEL